MVTYMTHPVHGRMPVYSAEEIERARMHGWELECVAPKSEHSPVEETFPIVTDAAPKRRGRPPKAAQ